MRLCCPISGVVQGRVGAPCSREIVLTHGGTSWDFRAFPSPVPAGIPSWPLLALPAARVSTPPLQDQEAFKEIQKTSPEALPFPLREYSQKSPLCNSSLHWFLLQFPLLTGISPWAVCEGLGVRGRRQPLQEEAAALGIAVGVRAFFQRRIRYGMGWDWLHISWGFIPGDSSTDSCVFCFSLWLQRGVTRSPKNIRRRARRGGTSL